MKKRNRRLVCCIFCGRDTTNKCEICRRCLSGEGEKEKPLLLDDSLDCDGKRHALFGFFCPSPSWEGFSQD